MRKVRLEMKETIKHFTDLVVWQKAHELTLMIYYVTSSFPKTEIFGLTNQLRRSATSISANIAEGMGRGSYADRARFYYNARGSIYEVENHLIVSKDLRFINDEMFKKAVEILNSTRMLLNAFISKTLKMHNYK